LNYLSAQSTINQCSSEVLSLAATIYSQNDGYTKPPKFIQLLERSSNLPLPAVHRAYLLLPFRTQKENILKNIKEQLHILAEQNDAAAQCNLGIMYANGQGISPEEMLNKDAMAVELYRKAAVQGNAIAQCNLGVMYANGLGIQPDEMPNKDAMAVECYRKAAAQGHARAQYNLGLMYQKGQGIPLPKKDTLAFEWFRKAAMQGEVAAQCNLGSMYLKGRGIPPDEMPKKDTLAFEWFRKAAMQGEVAAQCNIGSMYAMGRGIPPDEMPKKDTLAFEWFHKAAMQGGAAAQCNLGIMYEKGLGIPENEKADKAAIAYFWYTKCAPGHDEAKERLNTLVISPNQLKKADMMLARRLDYQQVNYLFQEGVFKGFLLLGLVIKNKNNELPQPTSLGRLPSDLLFKIAEQLASLSTEHLRDIYKKLIPTLSKELTFKAKYLATNNSSALFFKSNPIAAKVKSGAPILLEEFEKYAKEFPDNEEAKVGNQLKD
jgi:TPR repeat protein